MYRQTVPQGEAAEPGPCGREGQRYHVAAQGLDGTHGGRVDRSLGDNLSLKSHVIENVVDVRSRGCAWGTRDHAVACDTFGFGVNKAQVGSRRVPRRHLLRACRRNAAVADDDQRFLSQFTGRDLTLGGEPIIEYAALRQAQAACS